MKSKYSYTYEKLPNEDLYRKHVLSEEIECAWSRDVRRNQEAMINEMREVKIELEELRKYVGLLKQATKDE